MALRQEIKDDINANSTNTDIASFSRRTNAQAYTDTATRDREESLYYRFKEAKKTKGISDSEYALIKRYFSNNEIKAQNAVMQKSIMDLENIIRAQRIKQTTGSTAKPLVEGINTGGNNSIGQYTDTGTGGNSTSSDSGSNTSQSSASNINADNQVQINDEAEEEKPQVQIRAEEEAGAGAMRIQFILNRIQRHFQIILPYLHPGQHQCLHLGRQSPLKA